MQVWHVTHTVFFFFQTDTWMGDSPEFHRADLVVTPDSAEWAILLKLIFTVVEQWEWKWNELWNLQYFPPRKLNCSAPVTCSVLCESRCCSSSPQENFHVMSSCPLACAADGWFARGKVREKVTNGKVAFEVELKWGGWREHRGSRGLVGDVQSWRLVRELWAQRLAIRPQQWSHSSYGHYAARRYDHWNPTLAPAQQQKV